MLLRRRRLVREISVDDSSEGETVAPSLEVPEPSPDPEANYLKREEAEILSAAIGNLTLRLRTAIALRELGELSTEETARRMSLSVGAVKARVFHGRRKLRKILRRFEIAPKNIQRLTIASAANRTCASVR
jgi:RNA polymerase sigma factor (sigma-70 family)